MAVQTIAEILSTFNPYSALFRLILAAVLGGIIGWERVRHGHVAGMRTHMLVSLGAAMALLVGMFCRYHLESDVDITRIGAQVISGIGFLGVGTILIRDHTQVTGVTTAAGLWVTAAIGLAAGAGFYWGALFCTAIVVLTMAILVNVEKEKKQEFLFTRLYAELLQARDVETLQKNLHEMGFSFMDFRVCAPNSGSAGHLGVEMSIRSSDIPALMDALDRMDCIDFAVTNH